MSNLVLDSLEIKNFRAFKHLRIEKLGRVNLIVGKNNVGKSSVLEALWLYARRGEPALIWSILAQRDESGVARPKVPQTVNNRYFTLRYLFNGWKSFDETPGVIRIGSIDSEDGSLFVTLAEPIAAISEQNNPIPHHIFDFEALDNFFDLNLSLVTGFGNNAIYDYPLDSNNPQPRIFRSDHKEIKCVHVSAEGLSELQINSYWDAITLTDAQDDIISALRIVAYDVQAINLVGNESLDNRRIPKVRVPSVDIPVPLRSMGEGMNRMFGIALALVNAKDGMLLIDEVDTGLHYSVLPDLWKLIFEVAHRLNVQVFATSHSWDCIEAFQQAADANKEEEGIVIRLETQDGEVVPVVFDERKLNIATREHIEVR